MPRAKGQKRDTKPLMKQSRAVEGGGSANVSLIIGEAFVVFTILGLLIWGIIVWTTPATTTTSTSTVELTIATLQFVNSNNDTTTEEEVSSSSTGDASSTGEEGATGEGTGARRRLLAVHSGHPQAVATAAQITSLQYYPVSIQLCESLVTNGGSGFDSVEGCWRVFSTPTNAIEGFYESFGVAEALETTDGYIDMMDQITDFGNITITAEDLDRSYNFIVINWLRPIKINATLTSYLGEQLYTKIGEETDNGTFTDHDMSVAPSELSAVQMNNGGSWARLAQPFVLVDGDWMVTLAFNPSNIIYGDMTNGGACYSGISDEAEHCINGPFLAMNPIVHLRTDEVWKETYTIHVSDPEYDIRHELYYVLSAPEEVRAVDSSLFWTAAQAGVVVGGVSQSFAVTTNGTHWDFVNWSGIAIFAGFKRLDAVGDTSDCTLTCFQGSCLSNNDDPTEDSPTLTVSYDLVAVSRVY